MPMSGPSVAALAPTQYAAMENTAGAANAFGLSTPTPGGDIKQKTVNYQASSFGDDAPKAQRIIDAYHNILGRDPDEEGFAYWMANFEPDKFEAQFRSGISNPATLDPLTGLTMPGQFGNVRGYSSLPLFNDQMAFMQQQRPGQYNAYESLFVNPQTGAAPEIFGIQQQPQAQPPIFQQPYDHSLDR